jgi:hypothetical protein
MFPFLLPLRVAQRKAFFYADMRFDGHAYAKTIQDGLLPYKLFSAKMDYITPIQALTWFIRKTRFLI